jgi:hypothetical protein
MEQLVRMSFIVRYFNSSSFLTNLLSVNYLQLVTIDRQYLTMHDILFKSSRANSDWECPDCGKRLVSGPLFA